MEQQIYLCSLPSPPYHCTHFGLTKNELIPHLCSPSHPSTTLFLHHPDSPSIHALMHPATFLPRGSPGLTVFLCYICRMYFPSRATALHHWQDNHQAVTQHLQDRIGSRGFSWYLREECERVLRVDAGGGVEDDVGTVPYENVPLLDKATGAIVLRAENRYLPARLLNGVKTFFGMQRSRVRLYFVPPFRAADITFVLTASTVDGMILLMKRTYSYRYGVGSAEEIEWGGVFRQGLVVRYERMDGGCYLVAVREDRDVERLRREMVCGVGWVGVEARKEE